MLIIVLMLGQMGLGDGFGSNVGSPDGRSLSYQQYITRIC